MDNLQVLGSLTSTNMQSVEELVEVLTQPLYETLKTAIELGKWPDGSALQDGQRENCIQLVILYEHRYLSEQERTGYDLPISCQNRK